MPWCRYCRSPRYWTRPIPVRRMIPQSMRWSRSGGPGFNTNLQRHFPRRRSRQMETYTPNKRILSIDDEPGLDDEAAIREITRETLHTYGYKVLSAGDGAEGVAVFAEHRKTIKAVIADIMMPVMDGT